MTDRHLARAHEQYYDPDLHFPADRDPLPAPHCSNCNLHLPSLPDKVTPWADTVSCDGRVTHATQEYTEGLVDILGEEFRGKTYAIAFTSCGEEGPHAPHTDTLAEGVDEYRRCGACGEEDIRRLT